MANHNRCKQQNEPMRAWRKYMQPASSAGQRVRASHVWFYFYFWLVDKVAQVFKPITKHSIAKPKKTRITFDVQLKWRGSFRPGMHFWNSWRHADFLSGQTKPLHITTDSNIGLGFRTTTQFFNTKTIWHSNLGKLLLSNTWGHGEMSHSPKSQMSDLQQFHSKTFHQFSL